MKFESLLNQLEEYVLENWGECCEQFELNCSVCQQYLAIHILQDNLDIVKEIEKEKES